MAGLSPSSFKVHRQTLLLILSSALYAAMATAQVSLAGRAGKATGTLGKSLDQLFKFFKNDYTIFFIVYIGLWAFVYLVYRIGLEKSDRIPKEFCSRIAMILSLITITPGLYALQRYPTVTQAVKAMMQGWFGLTATFIGALIIYGFSFFLIRHYLSPTLQSPPAP